MFWFGIAMAVECAAPTKIEQLRSGMEKAEKSIRDLDEAGMQAEVVTLSSSVLPCLGEEVPPPDAARFHRLMAIHLAALGQDDGALEAARAAKALAPEHVWDDALLPPDHTVRAGWDEMEAPKTGKVPEPRDGFLSFDGTAGRSRPKKVPTISQRLGASGIPEWTTYVGPRAPLPAYQAIPRKRNALIACAAGGAAIGGAGWILGAVSRDDLQSSAKQSSPALSAKQLDAKKTRSNALVGVSFVGLAVAIGCGAGALGEIL